MICQNCNSPIEDNVKFCPVCGNPSNTDNKPSESSSPNKKSFWKTGKASGLGSFFIVLLAICLFFTSFVTLLITNAKSFISTDQIENVIEDISFESVYNEFSDEINDFKDAIKTTYEIDVSDEAINDFIARSTLKSFIAKKTKFFIDELLNGNYAEITLNSQMAYELLLENKALLSSEFGIESLTNYQLYTIAYETFGESEYCIISSNELAYDANQILDIVRMCLSDTTFIILIFSNLLMIFIILKINLIKGFKSTAIILIIISCLFLLIKFALIPLSISLIFEDSLDTVSSELLADILSSFFTASTIISIILLIVCIGGLIFLRIKKPKAKKSQISADQNNFLGV